MKSRLIAVITTGMMLASAASMPPVLAAEQTTPAGAVATLPDWIPKDLASALEFRNTYGATHIDNGLVCVVSKLKRDQVPDGQPQGMLRYEILTTDKSVKMLRHTNFGSEYSQYYYEIAVFDPQQAGDFDIAVVDSWAEEPDPDLRYGHAVARYSFSAKDDMDITETDIYGWLPDSAEEFRQFSKGNNNVSVKDNYVVFCMSYNAGTPYSWKRKEAGKECFETETVSYCSPEYEVELDGGAINMVCAYKAVRDGYDKISYDFGAFYANGDEAAETLTADCVVLDNAQTVLLSGEMRVTLVDCDTDELLTLPEGAIPRIWTDIRQSTPDGEIFCNMQPVGFNNNPAIVRLGYFFNGYNFSFGLGSDDLPVGYSLPDTEDGKAGYYNGTITPDEHMTVTKYDNDSADVVFKLKKNSNAQKKSTTITFYDADTDELIDIPEGYTYLLKCTSGEERTSEIYDVTSNPCTIDSNCVYEPSCSYSFHADINSGNYQPVEFRKVSETSKNIEYVCYMEWNPSGDINEDGKLGVSDVILLQKWLIGSGNVKISDFKAVDYCRDNIINVFDLVMMKKALIKYGRAFVEPDREVLYGATFMVLCNDMKLYQGPDESYPVFTNIINGAELYELGFMMDNDNWMLTYYEGKYGWAKIRNEDGSINARVLYDDPQVDKPVIYLYPEEETDVHVELELTEAELSTTYPRYNNGWDVTAYPDGSLLNKADVTHHKYLFWDAVNCRTRFDFSKGFCVAGSDTESFLKEKLTYMGLTEEEMNEFIVYWLPRMEHNAYNLIAFQGDAYTNSAKLNISPAPDSLLRVFITYIPLEEAVDIQPQQLETFERKGFTVVEWGGSEIGA